MDVTCGAFYNAAYILSCEGQEEPGFLYISPYLEQVNLEAEESSHVVQHESHYYLP